MKNTIYHDVSVRKVRIRVLEAGEKHFPALLLVHGFIVNHLEFEDLIEELSKKYHVIAPDLPGFGESEKPTPSKFDYTIDSFSEILADIIAAFSLGRVYVFGHSMGGGTAITLAADHQELVSKLILEDPLCYPFPQKWKVKLIHYPMIGPFIFKQLYGRTIFRAYFRDDVFSKEAKIPHERVDQFYDFFNTPAGRESAYATMLSMSDSRSIVARLPRIVVPTLILWGKNDSIFDVSNAYKLTKEIEGSRLEILNSGHSPHEEDPEIVLKLVLDFLESV